MLLILNFLKYILEMSKKIGQKISCIYIDIRCAYKVVPCKIDIFCVVQATKNISQNLMYAHSMSRCKCEIFIRIFLYFF
jgi:hypothetical protein